MRAIAKGREPASLTRHRQTPHSDYENYCEKDELRQALISEQRGLCCYCMGRIRNGPTIMKIEHWRCHERYPAERLNYRNLLGACLGGHGKPIHLQHCDTKKGDRDLRWNPADPAHHIETRIRYQLDGEICSSDAAFDRDLNNVLNLNLAIIKNSRKGVLSAVLDWWKTERSVSRTRIEREIDRRTNAVGDLAPYCQVAVWWLRQKLERMTR